MALEIDVLEVSFRALTPRGEAFVAFLEAQWTPAVERAWTEAYGLISTTMIEAASPAAAPRAAARRER